jgi:putative endonuclease
VLDMSPHEPHFLSTPSVKDSVARSVTRSASQKRIALGSRGEALAARLLVESGMILLASNWRIAHGELRGELDLIAQDGDVLVIVEVKTRRGRGFGSPAEAVTVRKQVKIRALAAAFLRDGRIRASAVRFDVIGVLIEHDETTITHLRGAF